MNKKTKKIIEAMHKAGIDAMELAIKNAKIRNQVKQ